MKTTALLLTLAALATPAMAKPQKSLVTEKAALVRETATLAAEKASQLTDKASFMAKDVVAKIPSSVRRAGKVAGYGSLTAFCGMVTLLFAKESLNELKMVGRRVGSFVRQPLVNDSVNEHVTSSAAQGDARALFINSSVTGFAGYMTLYFAQKTKNAYNE